MKNTRKSRKMHKLLAMVSCALLLVAISVGATVAYLTSQDAVTNTFTVGNVEITLDEADVKTDGSYETTVDSRVDANVYHLIPGHTYIKDPVVHVDEDSEDCWIFVKLENGLAEIIDATTIEDQMKANNAWTLIDETNNIYAYKAVCKAGDDVDTFKTFKLIGNADVADYVDAQIVVTAYAVQADGFSTAAAAWTATFGAPTQGE